MSTPTKDLSQTALIDSYRHYESLVQTIEGIVWEADAQTYEFSFVSDKVKSILGFTPDEWLSKHNFWKSHIYPEDQEKAGRFCHLQTQLSRNHTSDYRMVKADGGIIWVKDIVTVINEDGRPKWLRGIIIDITESKMLANLDHLEKEILELNSRKNTNIETVLQLYVQGIEGLFPQMKYSILRVEDNKLYNWASQSLPNDYLKAINNLPIGPETGSCGAAAFLKETVIVNDIENDVKWAPYKHLVLPHGLRACWSYPIIDSLGNVIAVLGIYYKTVKGPDATEQLMIERSAAILKVIMENRLYAKTIHEMSLLTKQGQELANFGNWQWNMSNNKVHWSDVLYNIYGLDENIFPATFEGYLEMLHPDDRERVMGTIKSAVEHHTDVVFEERIIRPDGKIRHLKSWARVILDEAGSPVKMIGACLDITDTKTSEIKMEEIAWMQSHIIRAPLASLMGLVNILHEELKPNLANEELLTHILYSAHQLDDVIRKISEKTQK